MLGLVVIEGIVCSIKGEIDSPVDDLIGAETHKIKAYKAFLHSGALYQRQAPIIQPVQYVPVQPAQPAYQTVWITEPYNPQVNPYAAQQVPNFGGQQIPNYG